MAKIYLASTDKKKGEYFSYPQVRIEESYLQDVHKQHQLVKSPEEADIILFATNYTFPPVGLGLRNEDLYNRFPERTIVYDCYEYPSPLWGGLSTNWDRRLEIWPGMAQGWCYFHPASAEPTLEEKPWPQSPKYLWSFKGSKVTHPIRQKLFELEDSEGYTEDTSKKSLTNLRKKVSETDDEKARFLKEYADLLRDSIFVACPRGVGLSSMRIFEAMRVGRVPVILSDAWSAPPFVAWDTCSIHLPEGEVDKLPEILREYKDSAQEMGHNARKEWERVFSPEGLFHYTVEACLMVLEARSSVSMRTRKKSYRSIFQPPYARLTLRHFKNKVKNAIAKN